MTHRPITDDPRTPATHVSLRFSSTRRGARLARQLAVQQVTEWTGLAHDCDAAHTVALVVAELAANAITHGSLPGRDFRMELFLLPGSAVRVEVTDTRPERRPRRPAAEALPPADAVSGRGMLLVEVYADRWGSTSRDAWTKTVWAEVPLRSDGAGRDGRPNRGP